MKQNIYDNEEFFQYYTKLRASGLTYNEFIEQPSFRHLLPSLTDKQILDLGCGSGQLAMYLVQQGAEHVTGTDISVCMLNAAIQHERITYHHIAMEDLEFADHSFDLVVSSLAMHYIADYEGMLRRIQKWLRPGGQFIFSAEHPIVTAKLDKDGWILDKQGNRLYYAVDNYSEEGLRSAHWVLDGIVTYHRKISTLINGLIDNGFQLDAVIEPEPTAEGLTKMPKLTEALRKPAFIILSGTKQG